MAILFAIALTSILYWKRRELAEAIDRINRRGPRPPIHPLPADDSGVLNRRRGTQAQADGQ